MAWGNHVAWTVGRGKGRWSRREVQKEMIQCKGRDTTQFGGDEVPQAKGMVNSL